MNPGHYDSGAQTHTELPWGSHLLQIRQAERRWNVKGGHVGLPVILELISLAFTVYKEETATTVIDYLMAKPQLELEPPFS